MKNRFLRFTFVVLLSGLTSVMMAFSVNGDNGFPTTKSKKTTSSEYLSQIRNNQITGQVSVQDVLKARNETQAMSSLKSRASNYNWTSMGPINFGGPTKTILFDNQDSSGDILYSGSTTGGLWKSTNYGSTWELVQMDETLNVSSISQASNGTIYVGTGVSLEPGSDKLAEGSSIGKGIFKSTSGDNFQLMAGTAPSGTDVNGDWAFIQKLAVDESGNIYAATNTGLKYFNGTEWAYAQADGVELLGKSCDIVILNGTIIAAVAGSTYISTGNFYEFTLKSGDEENMLPLDDFGNIKYAISTNNPDYIYASYVDTDGSLFNIYLSTDNGNTWRVVYPGGSSINDIFNGQGLRNNSIAVDPTNEKVVYVGGYDIYKGYEAQPTGYYSWEKVTEGFTNPFPPFGETAYLHNGINTIVFHPVSAGHVVFGTDGGMGVTKDNFNSLQIMNRGFATTAYFTMNTDLFGGVIAGSQFNGVHYIFDNGSSQAFELLTGQNGFNIPSSLTGGHNHISFINPDFVVLSDELGNFSRSEDRATNQDITIIDDLSIGDEFITPFLLWESPSNPFSGEYVDFVATDDYNAGDEVWALSNNYEFPFQTTLEVNVNKDDTISIIDLVSTKSFIATEGSNGGVYMTLGMLDYTEMPTWWHIGAIDGTPTCMAYSKDANYVWVGTLEGQLIRLSNISRATNEANADIDSPGCIIATIEIELTTTQALTSIAVDPQNAEQVIFTLGNYGNSDYVFASTNGMSDNPTFESIQANLPLMPAYAVSFEVNNDGLVFIGTENGLFYTESFTGSSANWIFEDDGFGNVPIFSIKQQNIQWPSLTYPVTDDFNIYYPGTTNYGAIYLGTFGAGAYVTKDFVGFEEFETIANEMGSLNVFPNPAQQQIRISYDSPIYGNINLEVYDLAGKLVVSNQYQVNKGEVTLDVDLYDLENGSYILRVLDGQKQYQTKLVISK